MFTRVAGRASGRRALWGWRCGPSATCQQHARTAACAVGVAATVASVSLSVAGRQYSAHAQGAADDMVGGSHRGAQAHVPETPREIFDRLDTDGSGYLSKHDVEEAITAVGLPKACAAAVIDRIAPHSNRVSFEEFSACVVRGWSAVRCLDVVFGWICGTHG